MLRRAPLSLLLAAGLLSATSALADTTNKFTLSYDKPAAPKSGMNEALPLGNGRLGAFIYGNPPSERIVLNEDSLWSGDDNPTGEDGKLGSYQMLGELDITLPGHDNATNYRRTLDISTATATVEYHSNGITYRREVFVPAPDQVIVIRLTADKPNSYTGSLSLKDSRKGSALSADGEGLMYAGALDNGRKYTARMAALNDGGSFSTVDNVLQFKDCNALTLIIGAGTDYVMNYASNYRGEDPADRVAAQVKAASAKPFDRLKAAHIASYTALFNRASLDLGATLDDRKALPTNLRKVKAVQGGDPELEALLFQFGRYLLISCSRPGSLPANLQGLWADSNSPPWHSDYHANINVEMNYWGAEVANLAECHTPLFDLLQSQLEPWRKATQSDKEFKTASGQSTRGWAIRTSHNITGGLGWQWDKTANAWYCLHLWEHFAFGQDKTYLEKTAYPIMKETCQFWEDQLKTFPDGTIVIPNGWSPEHGPHEDGVSYNQEIVWDLFNNFVEASTILDIDADYRTKIAAMRDHLATPGIGSWGQLLEWREEKHITSGNDKVLDTPDDHHRHTSHLFAVYPGRQISLAKTPQLAEAAKVSLNARGDVGDVREWSFAWRTALWARLHDGDHALAQFRQFFSDRNSCPNLFGLHPPMQIDGDFGLSGAIPEMLLQSHEDAIVLLPALPKDWPAGSATGLRARGGFNVDLAWQNGQLASATLHRTTGAGPAQVRYADKTTTLTLAPGESKAIVFP
jgi:alpha-L-fucosidase 2